MRKSRIVKLGREGEKTGARRRKEKIREREQEEENVRERPREIERVRGNPSEYEKEESEMII